MVSKKHYVTFYSPGTLFSEESSREIAEWSPAVACKMARQIQERHGAKPYGFRFVTRLVSEPIDDGEGGKLEVRPKEVAKSGLFFITGRLLKLDDIPETPETSILRDNMRCNDHPIVCENCNSWKSVLPFNRDDVLLDAAGKVLVKGSDKELDEYRRRKIAERDAERAKFIA